MALILAVNPAGTQSPTLSRLARELKGVDLIGAESYAVAIRALDQHTPDLVLLPGTAERGEGELGARLRSVPGVIPTLRLPPVVSVDFHALLADIKALLSAPVDAAAPLQPGPSPHLLAAANAAVNWVRTRRRAWALDDSREERVDIPILAPSTSEFEAPPALSEDQLPPSIFSKAAEAAGAWRDAGVPWLPRLGAAALLIAVVSAVITYWPAIREASVKGVAKIQPAGRVEPAAPPVVNTPPPTPSDAAPSPTGEPPVSGWLAVFSPFELSITEGDRTILLDDRSRAMLAPGPHKLRFQNEALGYDEARVVQIRPTETTTVNLIPRTTLTVTSNEPAEVVIDGSAVGQTPLVDRRLDLGAHTVIVRSGGNEREFRLEATTKPVRLEVDFSQPQ